MIACELPAIYVFPFWNFCYIIKQYVTMKVIKWADTGASLLDPVPAHLIAPKYEHELPSGNGKCEYFRAGLRECLRHGAILSFHL